jgi:hypothetical protein
MEAWDTAQRALFTALVDKIAVSVFFVISAAR